MTATHVCGVSRSILGQPWRWRGAAADGTDEAFQPDDLVDQLLLARGVIREELERHRTPTIRGFMTDPSIF
ncbi:MAG TPA: single-stranded-DNA-specific exonuclease RecJ, partial [Allosphingosinicella sp.]|nr:single-stranded-DNA-specific exonuclease RecJ [Allosphingosinicella sp.]